MALLKKHAAKTNSIPLYCLYNGGLPVNPKLWPGLSDDEYGCTIAPINVVAKFHTRHRRKRFELLHATRDVFPWVFLVLGHHRWRLSRHSSASTHDDDYEGDVAHQYGELPQPPWAGEAVGWYDDVPAPLRLLRRLRHSTVGTGGLEEAQNLRRVLAGLYPRGVRRPRYVVFIGTPQ
jgi:hypothetical protein